MDAVRIELYRKSIVPLFDRLKWIGTQAGVLITAGGLRIQNTVTEAQGLGKTFKGHFAIDRRV